MICLSAMVRPLNKGRNLCNISCLVTTKYSLSFQDMSSKKRPSVFISRSFGLIPMIRSFCRPLEFTSFRNFTSSTGVLRAVDNTRWDRTGLEGCCLRWITVAILEVSSYGGEKKYNLVRREIQILSRQTCLLVDWTCSSFCPNLGT